MHPLQQFFGREKRKKQASGPPLAVLVPRRSQQLGERPRSADVMDKD